MIYLFIGEDIIDQDGISKKDVLLKKIKDRFLAKGVEDFNQDLLYAQELNLKDLQKMLLCLPFKSSKRIVVIKDAQNLKDDIKEFILKYVKNPQAKIVLVLDISRYLPQDTFVRSIQKHGQVFRFKEPIHLDTFTLSRLIDSKKTSYALQTLNQLLRNGEKPERILGGLRYSWENRVASPLQTRKKLKILLNCDIDIKTGRLRSDFALERCVISLCRFS